MEFKKFSEVENTYRTKFLALMTEQSLDRGTFCVSEKVHGSNLAFYYDGNEMKVASKNNFLKIGEKFYNWTKVAEDNYKKVKGIYFILRQELRFLDSIIVYGEVFGGSYPHPDVPKVHNATKVQKGIHYHPDNLFYAFDLKVNGCYVKVEKANELFEKVRMFYAKTLFKGTLQQCLEYPNEFQTTIPECLSLPPIEDNTCEGVVIRPEEARFLLSGARVILKNKNEKWSEKAKAKKKPKQEPEYSEQFNNLYKEAGCLVTENRLRNVLSKFGKVEQKDFGKLSGLLVQDVLDEFLKDNYLGVLEKSEQKAFNKKLKKTVGSLLRANFLNIIDGEF